MSKFRHFPDIPRVPVSIAQREYISEQIARELLRNADHLETMYAGWIERGFSPETFKHCLNIAMKVELYEEIVSQLRRGHYGRLEAESYADAYPEMVGSTVPRKQDVNEER